MRVGVHLAEFAPDVGGGYGFQHDVFSTFVDMAGQRADQFVILSDSPPLVRTLRQKLMPDNVTVGPVPRMGTFDRLVTGLKLYSPLWRRIMRRPGPVERTAREHAIDCIWFLSGGCHEVTDTPYIGTVWDLGHRLYPWFPELSENGVWDSREAAHAYFLRRASYVIVGTKVGRDQLESQYQVDRSHIRILPHPTPQFALHAGSSDSDPGAVVRKLGLPKDFLLYPAQFWPHKNHANLLLALRQLRGQQGLTPTVAFAGSDKGNLDYIRQLVVEHELEDQIRFLGFVDQSDLVDLYKAATALVYPSLCGPENLPPLEAFALGCPVIAADVPGAEEQLGDVALKLDPTSPADIAEKIARIITDQGLRRRLSENGKARANRWTARDFVSGMFALMDEFAAIRRCWAPPSHVNSSAEY